MIGVNYNHPDQKILGLQIGYVVDRDDPLNLGRVRVNVPGVVEPASNWAWPLGAPGGGSSDRGIWWIPEDGAEVGVFFKMGDPDRPYYLPANWGDPGGVSEVPANSDGGDPDVRVFALGPYDLVIDSRSASKGFKIVDKAADDNIIEFDGVTRAMKISATTGIQITTTGQVEIDGVLVSINGVPAGLGQL